MDIGGILSKIEDKADYAAAAVSIYSRMAETNMSLEEYVQRIPAELQSFLRNPIPNIQWKLLNSPHLYTQLFKLGAVLYIGAEAGVIGAKWKTIGAKVAKGAGAVALMSMGSDEGGGRDQNAGNGSRDRWRNY